MAGKSMFAAALVAIVLLGAQQVSAHVCPPCECDIPQKRSVARAVAACAIQFNGGIVDANRTLQLLETVTAQAQSISGCSINSAAVSAAVDEARAAHIDTVLAADALIEDIRTFTTSRLAPTAPEFDEAMNAKLVSLGEFASASGVAMETGLGEILTGCFKTAPVAASSNTEPTVAEVEELLPEEESSTVDGDGNVALAWGLTFVAGVSTIVGAALVGVIPDSNPNVLSYLNALTAGVMIQGSLAGLGTEALTLARDNINETAAFWIIFICFFAGVAACVGLEVLVHAVMSKHQTTTSQVEPASQGAAEPTTTIMVSGEKENHSHEEGHGHAHDHSMDVPANGVLSKQSVLVLIAGVTLHNVAEGMATFIAALANARLGIAIAIAMVLHNVPEGFAISLPWYHATGKRLQGFLWAAVAGGAEILAAFFMYLAILTMDNVTIKNTVFACLYAVAGGMMTFIALAELFPNAVQVATKPLYPTAGILTGIAVMQLSLGQLGIPA